MSRKLIVEVVGDTKSLDRSLNKASRSVKGFSGDIGKAGRGAAVGAGAFKSLGRSVAFASGAFLGAAGFTAVVRDSINAASDLHEEMNKSEVVFGKSSKAVEDFAKTAAKSFGIAEDDALGMAATFGNLLHPMGITRVQAAKMSVQFVKLAADLASFNNASPEDTLAAIQSGLAGQVRPLRQYGIFLSKARIEAEALRLGLLKGNVSQQQAKIVTDQLSVAQAKYNEALKKYGPTATQTVSAHVTLQKAQEKVSKAAEGVGTSLTNQQKALATTSIIMRDSKDAQGDFARTSDGLANKQRILKAELKDTEAIIGTALMPTVLKITGALAKWLGKAENQRKIQKDVNEVVKTAGDALGALKTVIDKTTPVLKFFNQMLGGTKHTFELLFALGIAAKLRTIGIQLGFIGTQAAAANVGGGAVAAGGVSGLLKNLTKMQKLGLAGIVVGIVLSVKTILDPKSSLFPKSLLGPDSGIGKVLGALGVHWGGVGIPGTGGGGKVDTSKSATSGMGPHHAPGSGPKVQIPTSFSSTHQTAGLAGFPAVDIATKVGEPILAPEDGGLTRRHFLTYKPGFGGWTCYFVGHESGNTYFITHLGSCRPEGFYKRGAVIGTGGRAVGGMQHIHVGIHQGASDAGTGTSSLASAPGTGGATHVGGTSKSAPAKSAPAWKGATQATIIAAKASVTSMIGAAKQVIGGMAGPMDEIERAAIAHLQKLKEHLHPHMTAADLAKTKADIKKWGKVLSDEVSAQTKAAKRAFDKASKDLFRAFDKATAAGLAALAAPEQTPTEKILADRQSARDDAQRQQALADAQASGDAQAVADALYDIETARLEKIAAEERKAADKQAEDAQAKYQEQRDDQRDALAEQLDDWNVWLTNKKKSWNEFWKWIKENPNGGEITPPNIGSTKDAPNFGGKKPVPTAAGVLGTTVGGHPMPTLATGGMVSKTGLAVVHEGETFSGVNGGRDMTIHNVVTLDGRVLYEDWKKQAARDVNRNGGTGVRS